MGQTALKSRSHRRYYLNKVYPFLFAVAKRLFFTSRASASSVDREWKYRCALHR